MSAIITIRDLTKKYKVGSEIITALNGINLTINGGEFLCIIGTSGSGKTTLLHLTSGLERPTKGDIFFGNLSLNQVKEREMSAFRRKHIGFIFQSFNLVPSFSALENVMLPLIYDSVDRKERHNRAKEMLISVGLGSRLNNKPGELSGGQQQRVCIARALINNPKIVFADEPTGNLDTKTSAEIMDLLQETVSIRKQTLIIVSHDLTMANYADRVIHMVDGNITKITTKEELTSEKID